jgi:hypothetical protein
VDKEVIYLDQFAFSELFKVEAGTRAASAPHREFWERLHALMRQALLLQQAIFPSSDIHSSETLVARNADGIRAAYKRLGGDVQLHDTAEVEQEQTWECFNAFREGRFPSFEFGPKHVLQNPNSKHEWLPDMRILVNTNYGVFADAMREGVERVAVDMAGLVDGWRERPSTFDEVLRNELSSFGVAKCNALLRAFELHERGMADPDPLRALDGALHPVMREFSALRRFLEEQGHSSDEAARIVFQFWQWEGNQQQPFHRLGAYLFAALARKIFAGQRKQPTRGFMNDVKAIAAYAPHVDAMFLDRECAALLAEEPLRSELPIRARIFSLQAPDEMLDYLEGLVQRTTTEVRDAARALYGLRDL